METAPVHSIIHWSSTTELSLRGFTHCFYIQAMLINIAQLSTEELSQAHRKRKLKHADTTETRAAQVPQFHSEKL